MITIVDYGMGNLRSVQKAFEFLGARAAVVSSSAGVRRAKWLVLPGVGAFGDAMKELNCRRLAGPIVDQIKKGVQEGRCDCERKNPQGACCLGNVMAAIKTIQDKNNS